MNGQASGLGMLTQPGGTSSAGSGRTTSGTGLSSPCIEDCSLLRQGRTPPTTLHVRVVQWRDNEIVEVEEADTKKRQRDFKEFETSCQKRVRR